MTKTAIFAAAIGALILGAAGDAAARGHITSVQGAGGRGYVRSVGVNRTANGVTANRSLQTNAGYGVTNQRSAAYGDGAYNSYSSTTLNNGESISRSASAHRNGDGAASYSASRTGLNGQTQTVSGTVATSH